MAMAVPEQKVAGRDKGPQGTFAQVGTAALEFLRDGPQMLHFLGERALTKPEPLPIPDPDLPRQRQMQGIMQKMGVKSPDMDEPFRDMEDDYGDSEDSYGDDEAP